MSTLWHKIKETLVFKQAVVAASDGCIAARYLNHRNAIKPDWS